eukprot:10882876-Heterocapsa_arctica.AAC.1
MSWSPCSLGFWSPPDDLGFVPNKMVARAALPWLSPPGSQARLFGECPNFGRPNSHKVAHGAVVRVVTVALHQ